MNLFKLTKGNIADMVVGGIYSTENLRNMFPENPNGFMATEWDGTAQHFNEAWYDEANDNQQMEIELIGRIPDESDSIEDMNADDSEHMRAYRRDVL